MNIQESCSTKIKHQLTLQCYARTSNENIQFTNSYAELFNTLHLTYKFYSQETMQGLQNNCSILITVLGFRQ